MRQKSYSFAPIPQGLPGYQRCQSADLHPGPTVPPSLPVNQSQGLAVQVDGAIHCNPRGTMSASSQHSIKSASQPHPASQCCKLHLHTSCGNRYGQVITVALLYHCEMHSCLTKLSTSRTRATCNLAACLGIHSKQTVVRTEWFTNSPDR